MTRRPPIDEPNFPFVFLFRHGPISNSWFLISTECSIRGSSVSRVARILDRRPNGAFKPNIFIQLYDSLVFDDKKTFSLEENRSQSLKTSWKNCQLSYFKPFITVSRVSFKIPLEETRVNWKKGLAVKIRHRSRKKVEVTKRFTWRFHEGKEGKEARFEKQDVADENFARDNYKYEAEKDVR